MICVVTYNEESGIHRFVGAADNVGFLRDSHHHRFVIKTWIRVSHEDREVEVLTRQREISEFLREEYGSPCQFGGMSCETIARRVMEFCGDKCVKVQVLEDGYGGAEVSREFESA